MLKKKLSIAIILLIFFTIVLFFIPYDKHYKVQDVLSPTHFKLDNRDFILNDLDSFDSEFTMHNKELANKLNLSEEEAFIIGNLGKNWAENLLKGRNVSIKNNNDLIFYKYSYKTKFIYSGFCFDNGKPCYNEAFQKRIKNLKRTKYKVLDLDTETIYEIDNEKVRELKNFIVLRNSSIKKIHKHIKKFFHQEKIKIYLTDSTTKLKPDSNCTTDLCQEILSQINLTEKSIDLALYGYSRIPAIDEALKSAINRGVKIRLVYDENSKGENIYPDTKLLTSLIKNNKSDKNSSKANNLMHNKFYIFDDKTVITGSANLSKTDMSGFNSNSVIVIESPNIAKLYKKEFEQMFFNKFHTEKNPTRNINKFKLASSELEIYFSPQDKSISNAVLPLIKNAKNYIYIPTFVLTEKRVTEELINAKNRGVEIKIIMDALNASIRNSKHKELRLAGISVKTENYAGKMHSKSIIIDDKYTIIGSMNFSNSGENKNDENIIVIKDENISKFYKDFFIYQWNKIDDKWLNFNVRAESKDSIGSCYDGIDNNYDGLIDKEDLACK